MDSYDAFRDYEHRVGRWWMLTGFALLLAVPTAICVRYDAWPPITWVLKGLLGVAPIYWTVGTIEVLTYVPMLGTGGSYLGFFTGNLTSLKVPCALNAMEAADVEPGTEAGEVISTMHVHATHEECVESVVIRGRAEDVVTLSRRLSAEPGVRHGRLNLIPVTPDDTHEHAHEHAHSHDHHHGH